VSTNARQLEAWGLVERVSHLGDRRDFYRIAPELERTLVRHRMERLEQAGQLLAAGADTPAARDERVRGRLQLLARMHGCAAQALRACCGVQG
jgi:DNA-binding MarR family transcriptional regulator